VVEAKDDRPLPRLDCLDRTEGKGTVPPWEEAAPSNDDRVGVVCVPLVADVVEPTDLRAVACHDPVALGGGEQATELRLPPQALLGTPTADSLVHGEKRSPLPTPKRAQLGEENSRFSSLLAPNHGARLGKAQATDLRHDPGRGVLVTALSGRLCEPPTLAFRSGVESRSWERASSGGSGPWRSRTTVGSRACLISRTSHIPARSCSGTSDAIR